MHLRNYDAAYRHIFEKNLSLARHSDRRFSVKVSVIVPIYNIAPELLNKCIQSLLGQTHPFHEIILVDDCSTNPETLKTLQELQSNKKLTLLKTPQNLHISGASNLGAQKASGDFLMFVDNDDEVPPFANYFLSSLLSEDSSIDLAYGDENKIESNGQFSEPYYKPDWSPEHIESVMYALHPLTIRRSLFQELEGFRSEYSGAQDYDLFLRASRRARQVGHVREVIYHWRKIPGSAAEIVDAKSYALQRAFQASHEHIKSKDPLGFAEPGLLPGTFRHRRNLSPAPLVSILVPTDDRERDVPGRGRINLLQALLKSIFERTTYPNYEVVVAHNGRLSESTARVLEDKRVRTFHFQSALHSFNFSEKINFIAKQARGEFFIVMNDDMEIISPSWIEALLDYASLPEVGCVGSRLLYTDGKVQHAGVVYSPAGQPIHVMHGWSDKDPGHNGYALIARNYLSLTGAGMMVKKETWDRLKGFSLEFAIDFNDSDFCLRAQTLGLRSVYTPFSELIHHEQSTLQRSDQAPKEKELFFGKWLNLIKQDPYVRHPEERFADQVNPY